MSERILLIINADGFGFTSGINRAIAEAAAARTVSSISVNANFEPAKDLRSFTERFPHISVGVHLNPSVGKPVLPPNRIPSLVGESGCFHDRQFRRRLMRGRIDLGELRAELDAQVRVLTDQGVSVSHIDSHRNQHLLPGYFETFLQVARQFKVQRMRTHRHIVGLDSRHPTRTRWFFYLSNPGAAARHLYTAWQMHRARKTGMRMPDRLIAVGYGTRFTKGNLEAWLNVLTNLPPGRNELYCHPGYIDESLRVHSTILEDREQTLHVLTSDPFRTALAESGVRLVSFWDI